MEQKGLEAQTLKILTYFQIKSQHTQILGIHGERSNEYENKRNRRKRRKQESWRMQKSKGQLQAEWKRRENQKAFRGRI